MSSVGEDSEPVSGMEDRKAAAWAWPLILISVLFIGWLVNAIPHGAVEKKPDGPILGSQADLALLQVQSQAIIASASVDGAAAGDALETLKSQAVGIRVRSAVALLESFIDVEASDAEGTIRNLKKEEGVPEWLGLVELAVTKGVTAGEREELREEVGWFADLADGSDGEASEKADSIRLRSTGIIMLIFSCFLAALFVVLAGGGFLLFIARTQRVTGEALRFRSQGLPRGVMLEVFALYLGMMAFGEAASIWIHPSFSIAGYGLSIVVPLIWPVVRGIAWKDFLRSMGFHRGEGILKEIGCGIIGYSGVLAIATMGLFLTWAIMLIAGVFAGDPSGVAAEPVSPEPHPIIGWMFSGSVVERILCLLLASVLAPLLEEFFFRGALHRYLRGRLGFFLSALITGLIFAGLHPQGWIAIPALCAIGIGFSLLREWRDSLIAPMVAHSINNGALVVAMWLAL